MNHQLVLIALSLALATTACGKKSSSAGAGIPEVTPIVKAATPTSLKGSASASLMKLFYPSAVASTSALSVSDLQARFFSTGPTAVLNTLLPNIDMIIDEINRHSESSSSSCLSQVPVAYTVQPFGQTVTMYAQCYALSSSNYSGDPGLIQFGVKDGVTYIYTAVGAEWQALIVTPLPGTNGKYTVKDYLGLGYSNTSGCSSTWDGCSYGGMELVANSQTNTFELAVAGMGFGYCGAQLVSDGQTIYAEGSTDMGTSCLDVGSICVSASDGTTSASCPNGSQSFTLKPIGRTSTASTASLVSGSWGASAYPSSGPNVTFDGSATDSIHFGPTTPTEGVGSFN